MNHITFPPKTQLSSTQIAAEAERESAFIASWLQDDDQEPADGDDPSEQPPSGQKTGQEQ